MNEKLVKQYTIILLLHDSVLFIDREIFTSLQVWEHFDLQQVESMMTRHDAFWFCSNT